MPRFFSIFLGPELFWIIAFLVVRSIANANTPPTKSIDEMLVNLAYIVPLVLIPLTFALFFIPFVEKKWLIWRIAIVCFFGAHFVLERGLAGHSEQGPGVGTAYILGMGLSLVIIALSCLARLVFK